ncbi:FAS1-like dehydratase domain-containing protein [Natrinema halophilum]|uniref:FAS1-like dehydratase domain-containing protein n=1 Tax=Natrinema halophilum TaxID=1699371 RepID=UPI001F1768D5|nr:MaoC family dehydratase N-terminal domain-containing protein [Natrinema halophilum]UHQ96377.1 MaoC family dehydratase N-terminal domain-containing protein [Natrinema halophilum]
MGDALEEQLAELEEMPPMEFTFPVEAGKIEEFADAIYSNHEIFRDEAAAAEEGYSSIPAPLTFVETYRFERSRHPSYEPDEFFDEQLALHGAQEYDIHRQPEAGDQLTAKRSLEETFTKEGSNGELIFGIFKTEYEDADGEPVVTTRKTRIITE